MHPGGNTGLGISLLNGGEMSCSSFSGLPCRAICAASLTALVLTVLSTRPCEADDSREKMPASNPSGIVDSRPIDLASLNPLTFEPWAKTANSLPDAGILAAGVIAPAVREVPRRGVNWPGVLNQSAFFLAVEQGYRLGTQPGTREALKGPFFDDWFTSVKATKGWGDADDFLANYIGHPMQGSVTGFIFAQNDPKGRYQTFDWSSPYWISRLKATAWSAFYSTQFELGPVSEASLGNVGYPGSSLSGAVDLVMTPLGGLGWQVGEDALDKYLIMRIEGWTGNRMIQTLARGFLNPTRSFANIMRLKVPWNRDTRPGIWNRGFENR
jgi:hypothetical protein